MRIRRYNYSHQFDGDVAGILQDFESMLLTGQYVLTPQVKEFELAFAQYTGTKHAIGVNSGTDALILAFTTAGIDRGDEVITVANTFHATVSAIRVVGATPVLVDANPDTFLIDTDLIESAISAKTKAIVPVHLFGRATDMDRIQSIAHANGLMVIEDAAQAHGAFTKGKRVGAIGNLGCFSFHPSKNLAAAGDGGMIVTDDDAMAESLRALRSLGQQSQNEHVMVGFNSKLDALQARVLYQKLPRLDQWNAARRKVAAAYRKRLNNKQLYFQAFDDEQGHVFHLFQIGCNWRDQLMDFLREQEIDATVRYPTPIHLQPAFADCGWCSGQFPVAEKLADELLCLPIRPDMSIEEVDYVCNAVENFFGTVVDA